MRKVILAGACLAGLMLWVANRRSQRHRNLLRVSACHYSA